MPHTVTIPAMGESIAFSRVVRHQAAPPDERAFGAAPH